MSLATAQNDGTVIIWSATTGTQIHSFKLETAVEDVRIITFDRSTIHVAIAPAIQNDHRVIVVDIASSRELTSLHGHTKVIGCLEFDESGEKLISGSLDGTVRLWNVKSSETLAVFKDGFIQLVSRCFFNSKLDRILISTFSNPVLFWNPDDPVANDRWVFADTVLRLSQSEDESLLSTGSFVGGIKVWDIMTREKVCECTGLPPGFVNGSKFSPDSSRVVSFSSKAITLWNSRTGDIVFTASHEGFMVDEALFSPDGSKLIVLTVDHRVLLLDGSTGEVEMELPTQKVACFCASRNEVILL